MIFGWTQNEVLGLSAEELGLIHSGDSALAISAGQDLAEGRRRNDSLSLRCHTKERQVRHCRWYNSAIHNQGSRKITILSLVEDVTEQVAALENIYRLAHHDTLTGLPNRILLQDRLGQALASARRRGHRVVVMMLDLDRFKLINDTLGHTIGDDLLRQVALRLSGRLRASDTLARIGCDEFILIQLDAIDRTSAGLVAQRLLDALTEPFLVRDNRLDVGASIGITLFPDDAKDSDGLLRNADIALYSAKRDGRVIETVGHYNAQTDPSTIVLDEERARSWLARGAQPSDTVRKLLQIKGIQAPGA